MTFNYWYLIAIGVVSATLAFVLWYNMSCNIERNKLSPRCYRKRVKEREREKLKQRAIDEAIEMARERTALEPLSEKELEAELFGGDNDSEN